MQFSMVCAATYADPTLFAEESGWPVAPAKYDPGVGNLSVELALREAEIAEEIGFDMVSVSEHHYWPLIPVPNAALLAAALTQRVKRARIGWLGPLVSMSNPIRIAEEAAMLDELSHGRLTLLFLRGTPNEFLAYNVNPEETRERTQEAIQLIVRALTEKQPFGWEGRYYRYPTVSVWPGVTQLPHPPIFSSGNSPESVAFAARMGHSLAMSFYPPHLVSQLVQTYLEQCSEDGWTPDSDHILYRGFIYCGETDQQAAEIEERFFGASSMSAQTRGRGAAVAEIGHSRVATVEKLAAERTASSSADSGSDGTNKKKKAAGFALGTLAFSGGPQTVVEQIREFHEETGVGFFDFVFSGGGLTAQERERSLRLFGEEVIPQLRDLRTSHPMKESESVR